jgi:hypothetical protein
MITPKKKAEQLLEKFNLPTGLMSVERKQCALIAVDEILSSKPNEAYKVYSTWIPASTYWINVKEQIEKL